jgi:hypothetical protein
MSFFILSFLFNGCASESEGLSPEINVQLDDWLDIRQPKQKNTCTKIPLYKEPPVAYCTKKMSKDECLVYMSKVSMQVRYQMRKQLQVCAAINKRHEQETR